MLSILGKNDNRGGKYTDNINLVLSSESDEFMNIPKESGTGFLHMLHATRYSWQGFRAALRHEAAFRQELLLGLILTPVSWLLPLSLTVKMILLLNWLLILSVEMLNSALEAVVDMVMPQPHELAGRAKDLGSGAVCCLLIAYAINWGLALYSLLR